MKVIYLLRHAKSSWAEPGLADFDRPLNKRGRKAAELMGGYMAEHGWTPELVLCSPAKRAAETLELVRAGHPGLARIEIAETIYDASSHLLMRLLQALPDDVSEVMLIGHNPGLETLAGDLAADGDTDELAKLRTKFPTGALAILETNAQSWRDLRRGTAQLRRFVRPREIEPA